MGGAHVVANDPEQPPRQRVRFLGTRVLGVFDVGTCGGRRTSKAALPTNNVEGCVQDKWKVTNHLTLD